MRAFVVVLALLLGGCSTDLLRFHNPVGATQLGSVESAYGLALSAAVAYRNACARRVIAATCRPIVVQLQRAGRLAQTNIVAARTFIRQNPTLDASSVITAAQGAVTAFRDIETQYGVQ